MDAFAAVPAPPSLAEVKGFMEAHYRATLGRRQTDSREYIDRRGAIENLIELLSQQKRFAESEPLLRELLQRVKQESPQNEAAVFAATKRLLSVMLARMQIERQGSQATTQAHDAKQADALVDELLAILTRRSIAAPEKTLETLKLAVFQIWLGRKSEHIATYRRLMEWAKRKADQGDPNEHAALAWCLDPTADPALRAHSLGLAQKAVALARTEWHQGWYQRALAMANYRSRDFQESENALNRAEPMSQYFEGWQLAYKQHFDITIRFLRSMILFHNGKRQQARELFAQAELDMKPLPVDPRQVFESASAFDDIMVWLAYKEARELLLEHSASGPLKQP